MSSPAVRCEGLHFRYETENNEVLSGVDLEIAPGQFVVLAGPSGAGKSTFCRTLNNIIPLFFKGTLSGSRWIAGELLNRQKISEVARNVGMVFQDFEQQLFSTNALLEVSFSLENFAVPAETMRERMDDILSRFHLDHLIEREPFSMSGGEKQKLAIASVLAYRPQILILDEPTTDLDPESRAFVLEILPQLKDWVETVLIVDQETEQFQAADGIFLFRQGRVQAHGSPNALLTQPDLLEANSLATPDLIALQTKMGWTPKLLSGEQLEASLSGQRLHPIPVPSRPGSPFAVEVSGLTFRYEGQRAAALKNVSFSIQEGEFVGIVGHNGSGKSTLLRHLNGLQLPQQGSMKIFGKEVTSWNRQELSQTCGLVFQNPDHQIFNPSVREEVEFGPRQFGFSEESLKKNVETALETMALADRTDRDPFQLSKGERQRVAVASVLSVRPRILILDEPTTGLDYRQQKYLMNLLQDLNRSGTTVIIVTHALKLVGDYCNHSIVLHAGEKIAEGHPRDLFFDSSMPMKLPQLWDLSRSLGGNAFNVNEFVTSMEAVK